MRLVKSADVELVDIEGQLYLRTIKAIHRKMFTTVKHMYTETRKKSGKIYQGAIKVTFF